MNAVKRLSIAELLLSDDYITIPTPLAIALGGLNKAAILRAIYAWCKSNQKNNRRQFFKSGYWWTHNTYEKWQQQMPYLGCAGTIKRLLLQLEKSGLLISAFLHEKRNDREKWYRVDFDALEEFCNTELSKHNYTGTDCADDENSEYNYTGTDCAAHKNTLNSSIGTTSDDDLYSTKITNGLNSTDLSPLTPQGEPIVEEREIKPEESRSKNFDIDGWIGIFGGPEPSKDIPVPSQTLEEDDRDSSLRCDPVNDLLTTIEAIRPLEKESSAAPRRRSDPERYEDRFKQQELHPWRSSRKRNDYDRDFIEFVRADISLTKYYVDRGATYAGDACNWISKREKSDEAIDEVYAKWDAYQEKLERSRQSESLRQSAIAEPLQPSESESKEWTQEEMDAAVAKITAKNEWLKRQCEIRRLEEENRANWKHRIAI